MLSEWRLARWITGAAVLSLGVTTSRAEEPNLVERIRALGLPSLSGTLPAYYTLGHAEHARQLQAAVGEMNAYYQARLGVRADVTLALLDARDWKAVTGGDYSLPTVRGNPYVILMPATSDNPVFSLIAARKEATPAEQLLTFLADQETTFEATARVFVDLIGFHELGHVLNAQLGIDSRNLWLNELLASYWSYAYISERQPEWRRVFDLLGRPSKVRPKTTSLEDFERLYSGVDDYGWYQGMYEVRVREIYPQRGLRFLSDLKQRFPGTAGAPWEPIPLATRMKPAELIAALERIAPGFQEWAGGFGSAQPAAAK
jgi:hypothetical protein